MDLPLFWQQKYVDLIEDPSSFRLTFDGSHWLLSSGDHGLSSITLTKARGVTYSPARATYGGILKVESKSLQDSTILISLTQNFVREGVPEGEDKEDVPEGEVGEGVYLKEKLERVFT